MSIIQLLLVAGGLMGLMILGYMLLNGSSPAKEGQRRLEAVRYRHSENTKDKVESQLKKAIAQRKPKQFSRAGASSRMEALAIRLDRTGMGWSLSQYLYTSLGLALVVTASSSRVAPTTSTPSVRTVSNCWFAACARACR